MSATGRLLVSCPDQPGIVAAVTAFLRDCGANITHSSQYSTDPEGGRFFLRLAQIEHNQLNGRGPNDANGGSGIRTVVNFGATAVNSNATIAYNDVENFTVDGMNLGTLDSSTVTSNQVSSNGRYGLHVGGGATNNQVTNNSVTQNAIDGIRADGMASGNTIQRNRASGNGTYDCYDDTVGPGTAGTANFWLYDSGRTETRTGLCARPRGD